MGVRFVHTADVHIGMSFATASFGHALGLRRRAEIKQSFFDVLDYCALQKVQLLLIAGDLFEDAYMDMSELKDVQRKFESMSLVEIVICAGNHDALINAGSSYNLVKWSSNVHVFGKDLEKLSLHALGIDIYGFSWGQKEIREMSFDTLCIDDMSKTNILMLHGDAFSDSVYLPLDVYELSKKGFDYIALGHIHKPYTDNDLFVYPGSLEPLDFKELGDHGIVEGIIEGKHITKRFLPFAKRTFYIKSITINEELSFEEIKELAKNEVKNEQNNEGIYRLVIEGIKDEQVKINTGILKEVLESEVYYCEIVDETQSNYDIDRIKRDNTDNLIGEFIRHMEAIGLDNPIIKDALYEGLNILLSEKVNG